MKKSITITGLIGLSAISSLSAANIAWITIHSADNAPTTPAVDAGFTMAPDIGYTDVLTANGNTVTRIVGSATPDVAALNAYDLVIIGRSNSSGNFQSAASADAWNSITAPSIIMSGFLTRSSRLGFTSGITVVESFFAMDAITDSIRLTASNPLHPVFSGVALNGSNTMTGNFATEVSRTTTNNTNSTDIQRGISVNTDPLAAGASVIATVGTSTYATDPTLGANLIVEWSKNAVMSNASASVLGGKRLVFFSGTRENGNTGDIAGIYDLDADGEKMFINAVNYLAVPEPSTISLLGLGILGLLRRRRV